LRRQRAALGDPLAVGRHLMRDALRLRCSNRLDLLMTLSLTVFEPESAERSGSAELHRIREEQWIFGERYNLMVSDQSLNAILKRTPIMAAGVADHVWTLTEIAALLDLNSESN
jgi:hypothetical protein